MLPATPLPPYANRYPGYLPYPSMLGPGNIPVPNQQSFNFPTAQFAPSFFPSGSSSVTPFVYPGRPTVLYGSSQPGRGYAGPEGGDGIWLKHWRLIVSVFAIGALAGWAYAAKPWAYTKPREEWEDWRPPPNITGP